MITRIDDQQTPKLGNIKETSPLRHPSNEKCLAAQCEQWQERQQPATVPIWRSEIIPSSPVSPSENKLFPPHENSSHHTHTENKKSQNCTSKYPKKIWILNGKNTVNFPKYKCAKCLRYNAQSPASKEEMPRQKIGKTTRLVNNSDRSSIADQNNIYWHSNERKQYGL